MVESEIESSFFINYWIDASFLNGYFNAQLSCGEISEIGSTISFNSYYCNDPTFTVLNFTGYANTRSIIIGDHSFKSTYSFVVSNMIRLESLNIGKYNFVISKDLTLLSSFSISGCPTLFTITIEENSFLYYGNTVSIINCERWVDITLLGNNFLPAHMFEVRNLYYLRTLDIGDNCFPSLREIRFVSIDSFIVSNRSE